MFQNLSLRAKIVVGVSVLLFLLICLGGISLRSISRLKETNAWVEHTHTVVQTAMKIEAAAVDMETGMRGYLLAGKEEFLAPYKSGKSRFGKLVEGLKETVNDNPEQVTLLEEINETISNWEANVTENAIALRREIGDSKTMNDMGAIVGQAKGKKYFDRFRSLIATFIEREEVLMAKRQASVEDSVDIATIRDTTKWVNHTHTVIQEAMKISAAAVDMETGMRGYLLTGKEEFLEPYKNGQRVFSSLVRDLKTTVSDNPAQVALLGDIASTIDAWQRDVTEDNIELRREIGDSKTMDDMARLVAQAKGKQYFDKFRAQIAKFRARELKLMAIRQEASANTAYIANVSIFGGILIAIAAAFVVAVMVSRSITEPFQKIFAGLKTFSTEELHELNASFQRIVARLGSSAARVGTTAKTVDSASNNLQRLAGKQASAVEQTSSSIQQISSMVESNVRLAQDSEGLSAQAGRRMNELSEAMDAISDSNKKIRALVKIITEIGSKTEVIGEIVFQTKLLSFNASVEAERAGEHGRGFAVVAQEVGNLAQLSGKANQEISKIVTETISEAETIAAENTGRVDKGFQIVSRTTEQTEELRSSSAKITEASNQQSIGVNEVSDAIESINQGTQQVASIAESAADSSSTLGRESRELDRVLRRLNVFLRGSEHAANSAHWAEQDDIEFGGGGQEPHGADNVVAIAEPGQESSNGASDSEHWEAI